MKKIYKIVFLSVFSLGVFLGPVSVVFAQTPTTTATGISTENIFNPTPGDSGQSEDYTDRLQNCVFNHPIDGSGSFAGCLVNAFYYLILYPSGKFAELTGKLLDFFIAYSLDSNSYSQANGDFVNQGWSVVRDIANVAFIFMLLYIAIRHILQLGTSDLKKTLSSLIVAALLINFSLFFSKVIIDAGNILARAFYNNIEVQYDDQPSGEGVKTISQALVAKVNPQAILSSELFDAGQYNTPGQPAGVMPNGYAFFIMAVASFVNVTIGIVFLSTFLLFAARVIGLWFLMIFSPLAFASFALPNNGSALGQFGWIGWRDNILKLSFMAPVFLFFLFLLIMFLQIVMSAPIMAGNEDAAHKIMKVLIPFIAIIVILKQAKKIAVDMAGEFGKALTSAVGKIAGMGLTAGLAVATGGTALIGRAAIGKAGAAIVNSERGKRWATKNALFRNTIYKGADQASKGSFDFRNTGLGRRSSELLGKQMVGAGFEGVSLGKGTTKGGYVQRMEAYQKEKEAFREQLKISEHKKQDITYTHTDAQGNQTQRTVNKSQIQAETDYKEAMVRAKTRTQTNSVSTSNGATASESYDYNGWKKEKEKAEKEQAKAENTAKSSAVGSGAWNAAQRDIANNKARAQQISNIMKNQYQTLWQREKDDLKAIDNAIRTSETDMLKNYANSVSSNPINAIYDIARGGFTRGRKRAASTLRRDSYNREDKDYDDE